MLASAGVDVFLFLFLDLAAVCGMEFIISLHLPIRLPGEEQIYRHSNGQLLVEIYEQIFVTMLSFTFRILVEYSSRLWQLLALKNVSEKSICWF